MKIKYIRSCSEAKDFDKSTAEYKQAALFQGWLDEYLEDHFPESRMVSLTTRLVPEIDSFDTTYGYPGVELFVRTPRRNQRIAYFIFIDDYVIWYTDALDSEIKDSFRRFFRAPSTGEPGSTMKAAIRAAAMDWMPN